MINLLVHLATSQIYESHSVSVNLNSFPFRDHAPHAPGFRHCWNLVCCPFSACMMLQEVDFEPFCCCCMSRIFPVVVVVVVVIFQHWSSPQMVPLFSVLSYLRRKITSPSWNIPAGTPVAPGLADGDIENSSCCAAKDSSTQIWLKGPRCRLQKALLPTRQNLTKPWVYLFIIDGWTDKYFLYLICLIYYIFALVPSVRSVARSTVGAYQTGRSAWAIPRRTLDGGWNLYPPPEDVFQNSYSPPVQPHQTTSKDFGEQAGVFVIRLVYMRCAHSGCE